ncbi:aspartate aminotransferase family protein [Ktedonosporobacter rubrisoli]|uniref:alanine--glyoxylate transaminase n=1 Tax=Ktedonosporobacter rubrisoli TaxID=2509675 RepID=A0A4P6K539_KTERU|nr:aspartate aminotransferase family protein [Ktedonosporobacter rubrisoli]QBD83092.1 aspartate aminotransferase family protein [Ktedonosporobacter rubrisoli]
MDTKEKYAQYVNTSFVKSVEPVVVERAAGAEVHAADGKTYLDCFAGIAVVNAGHVHPRIAEAAKAQIDQLIHAASYIYYVPTVADLAETLARITPGALQKSFFCNSGAEAIEGALRLAKIATGKREIIALQMAFHGRTYATLSITGNKARKTRGGPYMPGVAFAPAPYCYRCPLKLQPESCGLACADAVEDVIKYQTSDDVAAFIVEPVLGEAGLIPLPDGYLARVQEILKRHGILLLVDEVQTGFGRTGKLFAIEHHPGVEPDMMAMAKGIAAGFPLGAFIAPAALADNFLPGEHLSTFGGNPVSCAAALANIAVLQEEHLVEHAAELGNWALGELKQLQEKHVLIGDVRGQGLMIGIELVKDRTTKQPATAEAARVRAFCREAGVLIGVGGQDGNVLRLQPPLLITQEQLAHAINTISQALTAC